MIEEVVEAWRINNRVNLRLLAAIGDEGLGCSLSTRGGRSVARQLAHLHTNRVWQLEKRAKRLAEGLRRFESKEEPDRETLQAALEESAERIEQLFRLAAEGTPGVRVFKRGIAPHMAYFVAHEAHHRGNILLTLKQAGHAPAQADRYALWDWDRI